MTVVGRFRKKPVEVDAMPFTLGWTTKREILSFCPTANVGARVTHPDLDPEGLNSVVISWVTIPTLEGHMEVRDGDYIIKGIAGEFYPCKPDIFLRTYEAV